MRKCLPRLMTPINLHHHQRVKDQMDPSPPETTKDILRNNKDTDNNRTDSRDMANKGTRPMDSNPCMDSPCTANSPGTDNNPCTNNNNNNNKVGDDLEEEEWGVWGCLWRLVLVGV